MTFEEWYKVNEHQLNDGTISQKDIWNAAQMNYPFAICDEVMKRDIIISVMDEYDLTEEEANEFVEKHGASVIDRMWEAQLTYINYCIGD